MSESTQALLREGEFMLDADVSTTGVQNGPSLERGLVDRLRRGEDVATTEVFALYYDRLVRLVSSRQTLSLGARFGGEDVVQSALRTFFLRVRSGQLTVDPSGDFWTLLALIALRKLARQVRWNFADQRSVRRETPLSSAEDVSREDISEDEAEFENEMRDELQFILASLPPQYREVVLLRLEGHSVAEAAEHAKCSERTVFRALERCCEVATKRNARRDD